MSEQPDAGCGPPSGTMHRSPLYDGPPRLLNALKEIDKLGDRCQKDTPRFSHVLRERVDVVVSKTVEFGLLFDRMQMGGQQALAAVAWPVDCAVVVELEVVEQRSDFSY